jgi:hypothetical protein
MFNRLIDGGYLSWMYGTSAGSYGNWDQARFEYRDDLIILDHPAALHRELLFPEYKLRRKNRSKEDPERQRLRKRVGEFQELLREDPILHWDWEPGWEADDLLLYTWLMSGRNKEIVGVDKDYFQVPGIWPYLRNIHGDSILTEFSNVSRRFPRFCYPIRSPRQFLLAQVLLGDRSDGVPRILLPRDFPTYMRIRGSVAPFTAAYELFGSDALLNVLLLLMPNPGPQTDGGLSLLSELDEGSYWDHVVDGQRALVRVPAGALETLYPG